MGFPTKVQLIKRKESEQWYINFPSAVAQAMEFERGETVEWFVEDKGTLALKRQKVPSSVLKKNLRDSRSVRRIVRTDAPRFSSGTNILKSTQAGGQFHTYAGKTHCLGDYFSCRRAIRGLVGGLSPVRTGAPRPTCSFRSGEEYRICQSICK